MFEYQGDKREAVYLNFNPDHKPKVLFMLILGEIRLINTMINLIYSAFIEDR